MIFLLNFVFLHILKQFLLILKQRSPTDVVEDLLFTGPYTTLRRGQSALPMQSIQSTA